MKQDNSLRQAYLPPTVEVIKVENEGVIALSGNLPSVGNGGDAFSTSGRRSYSGASPASSDLEDMINDILTIEQ